MHILESIELVPNVDEIRRRLHIDKDREWSRIGDCIDRAWPLIQPKVVFKTCSITSKQNDHIYFGRVYLKSRILSQRMDGSAPVFPYVITIGNRLEEKIRTADDILEQYYLDTIGNVALHTLLQKLETYLRTTYDFTCLSSMAPGSLADWPLEEQGALFSILGDVDNAIGVKLTDVFLMLPTKSESGLFFPTSQRFVSCQLCPRTDCDLRKARYDEHAAEKMRH